MTMRTKPSVFDSIEWTDSFPSESIYIHYQPGNGTRYCIVITKLIKPGAQFLMDNGFSASEPDGVFIVSWLNTGKSHPFRDSGYLDARYVAEKLTTSIHDGAVLAELIAHFTNRTAQAAVHVEQGPPACTACGGSGKRRDTGGEEPCSECGGEGLTRLSP